MKMNMIDSILLRVAGFCLMLFAVTSVCAQPSADTLWNSANRNYSEGNYKDAAQQYEQILKEYGKSSDLYFNLGNAYFKLDRIGLARLNYERARRLSPANPDIIHNLEFVDALQVDKIDEVKPLFITSLLDDVANVFTDGVWSVIFFVFVVLTLFLLGVFIFSRAGSRKLVFSGICLFFILCLASSYFAWRQRNSVLSRGEAVVTSDEVMVKSAPNSGSDLFLIHEGLKVKILDKQNNCYRIILNDGKSQGWIPREDAEII
jgi:tetratricopeptide (TPR) repeat protein